MSGMGPVNMIGVVIGVLFTAGIALPAIWWPHRTLALLDRWEPDEFIREVLFWFSQVVLVSIAATLLIEAYNRGYLDAAVGDTYALVLQLWVYAILLGCFVKALRAVVSIRAVEHFEEAPA